MSLTTYSELQAAIVAWSKRSDLTAVIPDFIRLAEIRIKSLLDVSELEVNASLTTVPNVDFVDLPTDSKSPVALWLADITPLEKINQVLPQELPYRTTPARPLYWAIDGAKIRFAQPADAAIALQFRYKQIFELSDLVPTNQILTKYPDVYLFGALSELADYNFDDNSLSKWATKFNAAIDTALNLESSDNKNVPLMTDLGLTARQRFNINRGY